MSSEPRKKRRMNESRSLDAATPLAQVSVSGQNRLSDVMVSSVYLLAYIFTHFQPNGFTFLSDLQKGPGLVNIIGIVSSASPERRTRTNGELVTCPWL